MTQRKLQALPRQGMMAAVRNRRAMIMGVTPFDAGGQGRLHMVDVEYTDGAGAEAEQLLWELEPGAEVLEPAALPKVFDAPPMEGAEFDAMLRASRWGALTPSLPFSGLKEDRPALTSPLFGGLYPEPYQLVPVLKALEQPRVALMLADAVGLGKTIQAGMVLRELMLRRRIRRVLVLCPAALCTQWRDELWEKFALRFEVVDRASTLALRRERGVDASPWRSHERVIASYHYVKQRDVLEELRSAAEPREGAPLSWDLLIVDEAHNLAPAAFGTDSELSKMLSQVSPWFEHRLFLSATPHNGHTRSFSGLLEALDPLRFTKKSALSEEDRAQVSQVVVRRLKSEINARYQAQGEPPRFSKRRVEALPPLRFTRFERELQLGLHDLRRALNKALSRADKEDRLAAGFAMEVLAKRLLSGPWAFSVSWMSMMEGLGQEQQAKAAEVQQAKAAIEEETADDAEADVKGRDGSKKVGAWLQRWQEEVAEELESLDRAVKRIGAQAAPAPAEDKPRGRAEARAAREAGRSELSARAKKIKADARFDALCALIDERLREGEAWVEDERLVVFTEYLASLDYLQAKLTDHYGDGAWIFSFYGGMDERERDAVKRAFNDPRSEARVLLATDAAGEGLNLQRAARYLLHWDIPWNPARMEQRNGRLDRHGQRRDVEIFHFDSADDASLRFLGKVLAKRSQTREDRVVTDQIFAEAILASFEKEAAIERSMERLERVIAAAQPKKAAPDELPTGAALPGAEELSRLEAMRAELDLSPKTLRDTLETALSIGAGRPRLQADLQPGRYRFVEPVPALWRALIDETLRRGGAMPALVFDPEHYVKEADGRPVYTPEPDSQLMHLGDSLYHRVMGSFSRYRFPGGPKSATRWLARQSDLPTDCPPCEALVLLTVEELAVNELREPCHQWVRTVAFPVQGESLGAPLPHRPAVAWAAGELQAQEGLTARARLLWEEVERPLKRWVKEEAEFLGARLKDRLQEAGKEVQAAQKRSFSARIRELEKEMGDNKRDKLLEEAKKLREASRHLSLFEELDEALRRKLEDVDAELSLRKDHYLGLKERLRVEQERTMKDILPRRYKLRGQARVYPIAVELRFF